MSNLAGTHKQSSVAKLAFEPVTTTPGVSQSASVPEASPRRYQSSASVVTDSAYTFAEPPMPTLSP